MENQNSISKKNTPWILACLAALGIVYIFQKVDYLNVFLRWISQAPASANASFAFNKTFRLILNDLICMALIYVIFRERKYLRIAFFVFCFELFFILPAYLIIKLKLEGASEISSPLLSQIHRLIVNPMLMLVLIVAFYYQKNYAVRNS